MDLRFNNYRLENVYLATSDEQRRAIGAFWLDEKALPHHVRAEQRAHEVVIMVYTADSNELAGVSTASPRRAGGRLYYAYRMFLRPQHRVPYLMWAVITATRNFLAGFNHPKVQAAGMLHINENPKLMKPGIRRFFLRHGYRYCGKNRHGHDIWVINFENQPNHPVSTH
ncbi:MAG: hypothetical protein NTV43_09645 [Methylococcales bacterium]|nr:hypothetical protein [Methylococcales bacterium]